MEKIDIFVLLKTLNEESTKTNITKTKILVFSFFLTIALKKRSIKKSV